MATVTAGFSALADAARTRAASTAVAARKHIRFSPTRLNDVELSALIVCIITIICKVQIMVFDAESAPEDRQFCRLRPLKSNFMKRPFRRPKEVWRGLSRLESGVRRMKKSRLAM